MNNEVSEFCLPCPAEHYFFEEKIKIVDFGIRLFHELSSIKDAWVRYESR